MNISEILEELRNVPVGIPVVVANRNAYRHEEASLRGLTRLCNTNSCTAKLVRNVDNFNYMNAADLYTFLYELDEDLPLDLMLEESNNVYECWYDEDNREFILYSDYDLHEYNC